MRNVSILIVEDDLDIRESVNEFLGMIGFTTTTACNGLEALTYLRSAQELPDIILLDLMMPVMDGFKFREEQERDSRLDSVPVLIMSADGHVQEKQLKTKAKGYLKKPIDLDVLVRTIEQLVEVAK